MKKQVFSCAFKLRFYKREGWTNEDVKALLKSGDVAAGEYDPGYWTTTRGSVFDIDKLLAAASAVYDYYDQLLPENTVREYIEYMQKY